MGHEIMVTTLQLAQACSIVANNGFLIRPRISFDSPQAAPVAVLKPETAITMRRMMENVVLRGTGKKARITGYTTGGKTGTAQIVDLRTHTYTHLYNASFMGFAPVSNPRVVVVVTVNGATGLAGYGGEASAPVFREIAATALRMMDVPPDALDEEPDDKTPVDTNDVAIADLGGEPNLDPDGDAPAQDAAVGAQPALVQFGPKVPSFEGLTMRAATERSSALGIPVEFIGSGIVRIQRPAAGSVLPAGERVRLLFRP
jgi:cell division protein FtsI (penicillin-binding protein 3)